MSVLRRSAQQLALTGSCVLVGSGCNGAAEVSDTDGGTSGRPSTGNDSTAGESPGLGILIETNKEVDILFVIDNSGSMGEAQASLALSIGALLGVLEADDVQANYRLGITTTDDSNYWCRGAGVSSPESGQFVLSSCRSRLNDFSFSGGSGQGIFVCTDICALDSIDIQPTTTRDDPTAAPRPWLESIEGATNLPGGVSTTQAMQCFAPQGINGCGFESHLESMWKALRLSSDSGQRQAGFSRDQAVLSIVFVTDEADCSFSRERG